MSEEPKVTYTTASGSVFTFDGEHALLASDDETAWEYGTDDGNPVLEPRTLDARLAYTGRDMREECARLLAMAGADLEAASPGTYTVGEWSLRCYLLKGAAYDSMGGWAGWKVSLFAPDPMWERVRLVQLAPSETPSGTGHDYPHDLAFDYGFEPRSQNSVDGGDSGCLARLRFYGKCSSPWVEIAGNRYGADVEVAAGSQLVIDPTRKSSMAHDSVVLKGAYGDVTDVFDKRIRGAKDSGSYVFQPVPAGTCTVTWPGTCAVDVELIDRRAGMPWT